MMTTKTYLERTQESGRAFFTRGISGSVVMLNLLGFRPVADYSATPDLAPASPISGETAYRLYVEHTLPHLKQSGGEVHACSRSSRNRPDKSMQPPCDAARGGCR